MIFAGTTALAWITNLPPPLQPENTSLGKMRRRLVATQPPRTLPPIIQTPIPACIAIDLTQLNILLFDPRATLRGQHLQNLWPTPLDLLVGGTHRKCPLRLYQHGALLQPAWRHQVVQWPEVVEQEEILVSQVAKLILQNHLEGPTRPTYLPWMSAWRGRSLSTPALM